MIDSPPPKLLDISPKDFIKNYYGKKSRLMPGVFPLQHGILSPDDLAGIANEDFVESRLMLYDRSKNSWDLKHGPFAKKDFARLPKKDWTLLIQDVDKFIPEVADLVAALSFLPHSAFDDIMISYACEGGSVGAHVDQYHVFLVQASGTRRWQIESSPRLNDDFIPDIPIRLLKTFNPSETFIVNPGDVLYLPPGIAHHGVSLDNNCVTYSFGLRAPSLAHLLSSLTQFIAERDLGDKLVETPVEQPVKTCGEISTLSLEHSRQCLLDLLEQQELFAEWWGNFLSEPKFQVDSEPKHSEPSDFLLRDENCRAYYMSQGGQCVAFFVNGQKIAFPLENSELVKKLCDERKVKVSFKEIPQWLSELVINGFWYWA